MIETPENAPPDEQRDEDAPAEEKPSESAGDAQVGPGETPGAGGYEGRDPKTDMPRMPTHPETQDDE